MKFTSFEALLFGSALAPFTAAAEPSRPRGVSPEFAKFYRSQDSFTCISNPSIHLSPSQINDDYCDCPDGSDEPGTSACSHLSHLSPYSPPDVSGTTYNSTPALPGFWCRNKGHQPAYVPFMYVNDGICDYDLCCDGSDEWEGAGGVKCEDRCKEIGKEWRKLDEQRQKSMGAANRRRKELIKEAARLRKEVEDRIQTLQAQIEGQEVKVKNLEQELADTERKERSKVITTGKTSKVSLLAGLAKDRVKELQDHLTTVREERDSARDRVKELEEILSKFKEEYNPNFNDEGVKRAVRRWEDYAARDKEPLENAAQDRDLDAILEPDSPENGINWDEWEEEAESDANPLYEWEEYLPKPVRDWVDQKLRDLRLTLIENGILASPNIGDGTESKAVTEARARLTSAQNELNNDRRGLDSHKTDLEKDYGPEGIFRALKGQCVEKDASEYTYEFCFMEKTTQKPKRGGGHTNMGNFVRFEIVTVDEELPPDGKGLGSGVRMAMKFENGQHCWNGPARSTTVIMACYEKDELWKIVEEEKCVYRMEVGTPVVCGQAKDGSWSVPVRDEL